MLESYFEHESERREQGIPPLPMSPSQTEEVCKLLENPPKDKAEVFLSLLEDRIS
ncbi:MAG: hypothetical protein OEV50_05910, partial [Candidatus Aminicenantes bacterium]|nr:hypothetical protein [Candidatus Aminicenantes bacterium]